MTLPTLLPLPTPRARLSFRTVALLAVLVFACGVAGVARAGSATNSCIAVGTTATPLFTPDRLRSSFSIVTTSGAATIYWSDDGSTPSHLGGASSLPLEAPGSYTNDHDPSLKAINVVAKSGTVWVCGKNGEW